MYHYYKCKYVLIDTILQHPSDVVNSADEDGHHNDVEHGKLSSFPRISLVDVVTLYETDGSDTPVINEALQGQYRIDVKEDCQEFLEFAKQSPFEVSVQQVPDIDSISALYDFQSFCTYYPMHHIDSADVVGSTWSGVEKSFERSEKHNISIIYDDVVNATDIAEVPKVFVAKLHFDQVRGELWFVDLNRDRRQEMLNVWIDEEVENALTKQTPTESSTAHRGFHISSEQAPAKLNGVQLEAMLSEFRRVSPTIHVLVRVRGCRDQFKIATSLDYIHVIHFKRAFFPFFMIAGRFDLGVISCATSTDEQASGKLAVFINSKSQKEALPANCRVEHYPIANNNDMGGMAASLPPNLIQVASLFYNETIAKTTRTYARSVIPASRTAFLGAMNEAVLQTAGLARSKKHLLGRFATSMTGPGIDPREFQNHIEREREKSHAKEDFMTDLGNASISSRFEAVLNLSCWASCRFRQIQFGSFPRRVQSMEDLNQMPYGPLLVLPSTWFADFIAWNQRVLRPLPSRMFQQMFRQVDHVRRSPFVCNLLRHQVVVSQLIELLDNSLLDGSQLSPGALFRQRLDSRCNLGPSIRHFGVFKLIGSLGRFWFDEAVFNLDIMGLRGDTNAFIRPSENYDVLTIALTVGSFGNRHVISRLISSSRRFVQDFMARTLEPRLAAALLLETFEAWTFEKLRSKKVLHPNLKYDPSRDSVLRPGRHDGKFSLFAPNEEWLRLRVFREHCELVTSALPKLHFSIWRESFWLSKAVQRTPHVILLRNMLLAASENVLTLRSVLTAITEVVRKNTLENHLIMISLRIRSDGHLRRPYAIRVCPPSKQEIGLDLSSTVNIAAIKGETKYGDTPGDGFQDRLKMVVRFRPPFTAPIMVLSNQNRPVTKILPSAPTHCKSMFDPPYLGRSIGPGKSNILWRDMVSINTFIYMNAGLDGNDNNTISDLVNINRMMVDPNCHIFIAVRNDVVMSRPLKSLRFVSGHAKVLNVPL
jgi:hypothetical protein